MLIPLPLVWWNVNLIELVADGINGTCFVDVRVQFLVFDCWI